MSQRRPKKAVKKVAKKPVKKRFGGPFLSAAFFCESIIEDKDGILSAMRILDTVNVWLTPDAPPDVPSEEHPLSHLLHMLLSFKSGDAGGKHMVKIVLETPSGNRKELFSQEADLSAPVNGGYNMKTMLAMKFVSSGVYWADVYIDGARVTRMPIKIAVHRTVVEQATPVVSTSR